MSENKPLGFGDTVLAVLTGTLLALTLNLIWDRTKGIERKLDQLISQQNSAYELRVENVIGREAPEKFYEINGEKAYVVIDGKAVEQYFVQER